MAVQLLGDLTTVSSVDDAELLLVESAGAHKAVTKAELLIEHAKLSGAAFTGDVSTTGSLGVGTATPNANSIVDISSTTKGFLPPRMSIQERDVLTLDFNDGGLLVHVTSLTNRGYNLWDGLKWVALGDGSNGYYSTGTSNQTSSYSDAFDPSLIGSNISLTAEVKWTGYTLANGAASSGKFLADFSWDGTTLTQQGTQTEIYFNNNSGDVLTITLTVESVKFIKFSLVSDAGLAFTANINWLTTVSL